MWRIGCITSEKWNQLLTSSRTSWEPQWPICELFHQGRLHFASPDGSGLNHDCSALGHSGKRSEETTWWTEPSQSWWSRSDISPRGLKEMAASIPPALTLIFQASYDQSEVPEDWKRANVTPLFKKRGQEQGVNYRLVSLTSTCCKILEQHSPQPSDEFPCKQDTEWLSTWLSEEEVMWDSTAHNSAWSSSRSRQTPTVWCHLLDFSKAFDTVPHQRLATKLHHIGNIDQTLSWIKSLLADRSQQVIHDGRSFHLLRSHPASHRGRCSVHSCS